MARWFIKEAQKHVKEGFSGQSAFVCGIEVYPQLNNYACGPWALRHCLMKWKIDFDPYELIRLGDVKRSGASERTIELMMWHLGSKYRHFHVHDSEEAKWRVDGALKKGQALILCTEKWQHWVACLAKTRRGYLVFDSSRPGPVIMNWSWKRVEKEMRHMADDKKNYSFISVGRPVHMFEW